MKTLTFSLVLMAVMLSASSAVSAQTDQEQRIKASYILALGTGPTQAELDYWKTRGNLSIQQLIEFHRQGFASYPNLQKQAIGRSYADAFGRWPSIPEIDYQMKSKLTYTELMKSHMAWLQQPNNTEYGESIKRSYVKVFNRQPTAAELSYWKQWYLSNLMLITYHNDYKNQTAKGNKVNVKSSPYIVSVSLSPAIAAEARAASGIVASGAGNIVASGAGNLITNDGGSIVASGAGN